MHWFPMFVAVVRDVAFQRIDAAARGHWLALAAYCAERETGGTVGGARDWTARDWLIGVGIDLADVELVVASGLAEWAGRDLVVAHYDASAEDRANTRRDRARLAAIASHAPTAKRAARKAAPSSAPGSAQRSASSGAEERRGEEITGKDTTRQPSASAFELTSPPSTPERNAAPLEKHRADALRLWDLQETLRTEAIPGTRRRPPTDERLKPIADRLEAGATVADCEHALRVRAAEAKLGGEHAKYFNGESNWRPRSFEFALGQPDPAVNPPRNGAAADHGSNGASRRAPAPPEIVTVSTKEISS